MPSQRILVLAQDPHLLDALSTAVQAGGGAPVRASGPEVLEGPQVPHRLVIYAWDGNPGPLFHFGQKLRPSAQLVAITPPRPLARQLDLFAEGHCNHVLPADESGLTLLTRTVAKFVSGDLFGIEKYVPVGTDIHLLRLRDYEGRQRAIDEILAFAEASGLRRQIRSAVAQVSEELLMNALYDAPVDEAGEPIFAEVDLKERLSRLSPRPVSLRFAFSEGRLILGVRDRFGRLTKATILRFIRKCLESPEQIDRKTYGAGLGLYLIATAATHYIVNVAPGMATEVICSFDKNAKQPLQALSVFVYPGTPEQIQAARR